MLKCAQLQLETGLCTSKGSEDSEVKVASDAYCSAPERLAVEHLTACRGRPALKRIQCHTWP